MAMLLMLNWVFRNTSRTSIVWIDPFWSHKRLCATMDIRQLACNFILGTLLISANNPVMYRFKVFRGRVEWIYVNAG